MSNPFDLFELDEELDPMEALHRIEQLCLEILQTGQVTFAAPNLQEKFLIDGALRVGRTNRTLHAHSEALAKCLVVATFSFSLLLARKTSTTREIYYRNKQASASPSLPVLWHGNRFKNEEQAQRTIGLTSQILGLTRASLSLEACSKGLCAGLAVHSANDIIPIPSMRKLMQQQHSYGGQWEEICRAVAERGPRFILVLEKHTVLFKLVQTDFMSKFPCIAITGKGFPDLDTRAFLRLLHDCFHLPVFGLCDLNPHGLSILSTYAYGSVGGSFSGEAFRHAVPTLQILGLTSKDGEDYEAFCEAHALRPEFAAFTAQDDSCLKGLMKNNLAFATCSKLFNELEHMQKTRRKLDLDSLECIEDGFLFNTWLPNKLGGNNNNNALWG